MASEPDSEIARHVEMLHAYHLDLWSEIEAQLRVLRMAQEEIAKLRQARIADESHLTALRSAKLLAAQVQMLKGRTSTLSTTVSELETTVNQLIACWQDRGRRASRA